MNNKRTIPKMRKLILCSILVLFCWGCENDLPSKTETFISSDMGGVVINGVKWATRNVDKPGTFAAKPEDAGMFYQWNRKIGWSATDPMVNSNGGNTWYGSNTSGTTWEKSNDPSPAGWRVPTVTEFQSLCNTDKVRIEWTILNGVPGVIFTDKVSDNSLFLPAVGLRAIEDGTLNIPSFNYSDNDLWMFFGNYWSSTQFTDYVAYILTLERYNATYLTDMITGLGFSVRCVAE
jgi:uncharacterized protein (TIGR02145 family)